MTRALAVLYYYLVPDFIASKITLFELFKGDYFTPARVPRSSFSVDTTMRGDARMILASEWCYWVCSPIFVSLPCAEQVLDLRMLFLRARSINSETIKQTQDSKLQRSHPATDRATNRRCWSEHCCLVWILRQSGAPGWPPWTNFITLLH